MRLRNGIHHPLEEEANRILREALAHLPRSEKMDVLTPWKEKDRLSREVYAGEGVVDPSIRRGMYHRMWNSKYPHLNSQDGHTKPKRVSQRRDESGSEHGEWVDF